MNCYVPAYFGLKLACPLSDFGAQVEQQWIATSLDSAPRLYV
jgi:hypothetical protein